MCLFKIPKFLVAIGFAISIASGGCAEKEAETGTPENTEVTETTDLEPTPELNFEETIEDAESTFAPGRVLDVKVSISESDWNKLRFEHRDPVEFFGHGCREQIPDVFNYYPSNVTLDGEDIGQVGVRTKGLVGSINPARPSLKLKLQEYQDELFYQERKRFTFNNQTTDIARVSTCMAFYIFRKMGVPASRCNFAHIHVNENDMGIYANVEPIKKPMLQRLFGDDSGNLYEGTASDIRNDFDARVEKKTNEDEDDWSDVERLKAALDSTADDAIDQIAELVDIDAFLAFTAATVMVGHWDSFSGNANNYYFYRDPTSDKFFFLPWGPDDTFSNENKVNGGRIQPALGGSMLARRLLEDPVIMTRYRNTMRTMLQERWDDEEILGELNRMEALIAPHVAATNTGFADAVNDVREYISSRKQNLLNAVNADPIPFSGQLQEAPICMQVSGELNVAFTATWDTLGAQDPFSGASGTLSATYGEFNFDSQTVGAMMGEVGSPGATEMGLMGVVGGGQAVYYRLMLPTEAIQPNSVLEMGDPRVSALMVMIELATMNIQVMGFLGEGQFVFGDQVDLTPGGTVEGELTAAIWGGFAEAYGSAEGQ